MAEAKTKRTGASVEAFLAEVPDETRRADARVVLEMMREATGEEPEMWGPSIIGFGTSPVLYADGTRLDWPAIAFSPRKANLVLYLPGGYERLEAFLQKLGPNKSSVSCLYLGKLSKVDLGVLREMVEFSLTAEADGSNRC